MMSAKFVFGNVIFLMLGLCFTIALNDEKRLIKHLISNYERVGQLGRPTLNSSEPIKVNVSYGVIELTEFDILNQELVMVGWTSLEWDDSLLRWDPEDFSGVNQIVIPSSSIWIPDVILINSLSAPEEIHETGCHVANNGRVTYVKSHKYHFYCKIPTDKMESNTFPCSMQFASWSLDDDQLVLKNKRDRFDANYYVSNRNWEIYKNRAKVEKMDLPWGSSRTTDQVVYDFVLKRREPLVKKEDLENAGVRVLSSFTAGFFMCMLGLAIH